MIVSQIGRERERERERVLINPCLFPYDKTHIIKCKVWYQRGREGEGEGERILINPCLFPYDKTHIIKCCKVRYPMKKRHH